MIFGLLLDLLRVDSLLLFHFVSKVANCFLHHSILIVDHIYLVEVHANQGYLFGWVDEGLNWLSDFHTRKWIELTILNNFPIIMFWRRVWPPINFCCPKTSIWEFVNSVWTVSLMTSHRQYIFNILVIVCYGCYSYICALHIEVFLVHVTGGICRENCKCLGKGCGRDEWVCQREPLKLCLDVNSNLSLSFLFSLYFIHVHY